MANPNPSAFFGNVQWKIVKEMENSDFVVFSISPLPLPTCLNFRNASRNPFGMHHKLFSINVGLRNPLPSSFLCIVLK